MFNRSIYRWSRKIFAFVSILYVYINIYRNGFIIWFHSKYDNYVGRPFTISDTFVNFTLCKMHNQAPHNLLACISPPLPPHSLSRQSSFPPTFISPCICILYAIVATISNDDGDKRMSVHMHRFVLCNTPNHYYLHTHMHVVISILRVVRYSWSSIENK